MSIQYEEVSPDFKPATIDWKGFGFKEEGFAPVSFSMLG